MDHAWIGTRLIGAALILGAVLVHASGCILVVPTIDHGDHCGFTGTSACATCLRKSCQPTMDTCCNDAACRGADGHSAILDAIDACAGGNATSCASGISSGDSAAAAGLRSCVVTSCKDSCVGTAPVKVDWSCTAARTSDTDCATCIYDSCGTTLDQCCGDASCKRSTALADDMGACTGGDAAGCSYLKTKSTSGYEGKVRACIVDSCGTKCLGTGRTHQSCQLLGGGSHCQCNDAEKSSGPECSKASVGGSCVLGTSGCTCGHYECSAGRSGGSCSCSFTGATDSSTGCDAHRTTTGSFTEGRCCIHREGTAFSCECSDSQSSCFLVKDGGDEYDTPTCNVEDVMAQLVNVLVPTCSN